LALHNIYNRDARVEVDSDARREEIDVWEDVKREEKQKKEKRIKDDKVRGLMVYW
jgi:hypothetical protein